MLHCSTHSIAASRLLALLLLTPAASACAGLNAPTLLGPGSTNAPGPELGAQTIYLRWQAVPGAGGYSVFLRDLRTKEVRRFSVAWDATDLELTLASGDAYRWNMAAMAGTNLGAFSETRYFHIRLEPDRPVVTEVSPSPVPAIDTPQVFTVYGLNFMHGSEVILRQKDSGETFRNRKQIYRDYRFLSIRPDFTSVPGHWSVEVINPGGLSSGEFPFAVVSPDQIPAWRWWRGAAPWAWAALLAFCTAAWFWWWTARRRLPRAVAATRHQTQREERARFVRDLHDRASADIAYLAQLADETSLESSAFPPTVRERARELAAAARDAETAIGDLLWAADPASEHLPQLAAHLRAQLRERLKPHGIEPDFSAWPAPIPDLAVSAAVVGQVMHLCHEVLNNVVKHARATKLATGLAVDDTSLTLAFRDNGQGLQPRSQPAGGRGLANMRARVQRLGGSVQIKSAPGQGTEVTIRLPLEHDGIQ